jgi:hypothetical protein
MEVFVKDKEQTILAMKSYLFPNKESIEIYCSHCRRPFDLEKLSLSKAIELSMEIEKCVNS